MIEGIFAPALMPSSSQVSLEPCVQGARRRGVGATPHRSTTRVLTEKTSRKVEQERLHSSEEFSVFYCSSLVLPFKVHQQLSVEAAPTRAMVPGRGAIDQAPGAAVGAP